MRRKITFTVRPEIEQEKTCSHINIFENGSCADCGCYTERVSRVMGNRIVKQRPSAIVDILNLIDVNDDIKNRAIDIFNIILGSGPRRRNKNKSMQVFYSLFNAYLENDQYVDPVYVADLVKLAPSDIQKALTMFSEAQTGYRPPKFVASPLNFIPDFCNKLGLHDHIENIIIYAKDVIEKNESLKNELPRPIAASIIFNYSKVSGFSIQLNEISKGLGICESTIRQKSNRINKK